MFVLCVLYSKDESQKPGHSGQRSSTDEVQRTKRNEGGGRDFPHLSGPGAHPAPYIQWAPRFFRGGKAGGHGFNHPPSIQRPD
jgi:hypothetical protein